MTSQIYLHQALVNGESLKVSKNLIAEGSYATPSSISERMHEDQGNVGHDLSELVADDLIIKGEKIGRLQPYYLREIDRTGDDDEIPNQ